MINKMNRGPELESIIQEIHRRAEKEWAADGNDFTVTITAEQYKAFCEEDLEMTNGDD